MPSLIEWLDSVGSSAIDLTKSNVDIKSYIPFQINTGLSQNLDTVMFANEMNKNPQLSNHMQYKFLLGSINKKRRYGKWAKIETEANKELVDLVSTHYSINRTRAVEYIAILTPEQIESIKQEADLGGCSLPKRGKSK